MKKIYLSIFVFIGMMGANLLSAQTQSTFEGIASADSFMVDTNNLGLINGNAYFSHTWVKSQWGNYWGAGWRISTKKNDSTIGPTNKNSAITAGGFQSNGYAVGFGNSKVILQNNAVGKMVSGFYYTNATYTYYSMKHGDKFAKKFGGKDGTYPDYLKLGVHGWSNGTTTDTVWTMLADFTNDDSRKDYILKSWKWLSLEGLGNIDSLKFVLNSSDTGKWGMNTPAFFAIDNFTTLDRAVNISNVSSHLNIYPNPTAGFLNIDIDEVKKDISIYTMSGQLLESWNTDKRSIDISNLETGTYILRIISDKTNYISKIIKQ